MHGGDIPCLRPHEHRFRHASGDIVHLQFFIERIEKGIGNRLDGIHAFQELHKVFVAIGKQKFCEGHRVNLQEVDLAHRERGWFCQGNAQQRTGAGDMLSLGAMPTSSRPAHGKRGGGVCRPPPPRRLESLSCFPWKA